jgi:branched-chain amino acid transport system ATP-binding protein
VVAVSLLSVRGITRRFGGVVANRDVSFEVAPGELVGVIGPNGAGKSTLFEVVTGFQRPDAGEVLLEGRRLTGLPPDRVCRLGVVRTFQKLRPFHGLTVLENVLAGALTRTRDVREGRRQAAEIVERVGLADKRDAFARTLSTGQRKRLELARALATRPRLLLLDEVTGGVDQGSIPGLVRLVQELHRSGLTLIVIEHNMRVITAVAPRLLALHLGEVIADGPTERVTRDPRVVEAYLGRAYAGSHAGSDPNNLADRRTVEHDGV